ncbi:MAG: hypothetical protein NUV96_00035 [Candidatus Colwellbacteria bacterium]|nr:hypothetical protein [Candidatus Colwellbacteria bacterium]
MPKTKRIDTEVKKRFVKAMMENGNNRTQAYMDIMPTTHSRNHAHVAGSLLFKDPEVQQIFKTKGIDMDYLAAKNKDLMESKNENIQVQLVKQFNQVLLRTSPTEQRKLNINLFGDLNDAQVERIRQGRKAITEDGGAGESQSE